DTQPIAMTRTTSTTIAAMAVVRPQRRQPERLSEPGAEAVSLDMAAASAAQCVRQQGVDERLGVEHPQVFELLADSGKPDRNAELACQRKHDAALGGAVQFGHHQPGDLHGGMELAQLRQGVL